MTVTTGFVLLATLGSLPKLPRKDIPLLTQDAIPLAAHATPPIVEGVFGFLLYSIGYGVDHGALNFNFNAIVSILGINYICIIIVVQLSQSCHFCPHDHPPVHQVSVFVQDVI